jgi:HK97 family phage major capsid protein
MNTVEKRRARAALITEARAILNRAEGENRDLTADEQTQYDAKLVSAEEMKTRIDREERQMALDAENARSIGGVATAEVNGQAAKKEPGQGFIDCVRSIAHGGRDRRAAADFAENTLHNPDVARALGASAGATGGFAVPTQMSQEFIEYLRPKSVIRSLGPRVLPMPNGNLTLPKITGGATATWIGENAAVVKTEQTLGQVKLSAKKLGALVPISNDLVRFANPQTDTVIREDLVRAIAQGEDLAFIRGDGTAFTPRGLKNWIATANSFGITGATITLITADLGTAMSNLATNNVDISPADCAWIFAPRTFIFLKTLRNSTTGQYAFPEMQGPNPTLLGYRVAMTSQIPINLGGATNSEFYFVHVPDLVIGEAVNMIVDVSSEASYVDENGNTVSAYALDQTVIRVIEENDFAMRYPTAASIVTAVTY